jgi:hypothetical protein
MKTLALLLFAAVLVLSYLLYRQHTTIIEQQHRLADLESKAATAKTKSQSNSLEYQEKCAEQARKTFDDLGYKPRKMAVYENHYNAKFNKCFMLIENTDATYAPTIWTHRSLLDAYEGKVYGDYSWHTVKGKKYWEVPPFMCKVALPTGEDHFCKSDDEFQELARIYMGQ